MTPFPALMTPLPKTFPINKEIICPINEVAIGTNIAGRDPPSCSFISCFTFSVTPSINAHEFSSDFMILMILFISFQMNKLNPLPAFTAALPRIFFSKLSITDKVALVANYDNISFAMVNSTV